MPYQRGLSFSIVLVFTVLSMLGWFFIPLLSVRLQPSASLPSYTVTSNWGTTSPLIVEAQLTSKLESALNTIPGITKINSVSSTGNAKIDLEVNKYVDPAILRYEISSMIRRLYHSLPQGVSYPQVMVYSPDNEEKKPLLIYTLSGADDSYLLQKYAQSNIIPQLALVPGIDKTVVYGGTGYEWQIAYKNAILKKLSITPQDISEALRRRFYKGAAGIVIDENLFGTHVHKTEIRVKISSLDTKQVIWNNIPVKKVSNKIILLGDIATIKKVKQPVYSYFRINGKNAVNIVIYPSKKSNILKVSKIINTQIERFRQLIPAGYHLDISYDSTKFVKTELQKIIQRSVLTLLILLLFVFFVSFNFRYVLVIVLSLFTNISVAFIFYYLFGIEIHLYSLAGITVSLGLVIDNSIVMADHLIYRKNMRVYTALLASTLTTVGALVLVWFLPHDLRLKLWDFAFIIIINLTVSLIVSLFYIPALLRLVSLHSGNMSLRFRRRRRIVLANKLYVAFIGFLLKYRKIAVVLLILLFGLPVFLLPARLENNSQLAELYNHTLGSFWFRDHLKPYISKYLGGTLRLFSYYVFENSYYTGPKETKLYVKASLPKGATVKHLNTIITEMEKFLEQYSDKVNFYTKITGPQYAEIVISFKNDSPDNMFPYLLKSRIVSKSINMGGINWNIYGVGKGFSASTDVNEMINYKVALYGYNYNQLEKEAVILRKKLLKNPRVRNVNIAGNRYWWQQSKSYDFFINANYEKMDYQGSNSMQIYNAFKDMTLQGGTVMTFFTGTSYEKVNIVPAGALKYDRWNLMHLPDMASGHTFDAFFKINKEPELQAIYKENQNYIRLVDYQYVGASKFGDKFLKSVLSDMQAELPVGYTAKSLSYSYRLHEASVPYILLILIISAIIFFLCAVLFESLRRPFAIILTIPASFIGVFLTFYIFDLNFDQGGYASFVLISGLVVNSAIYLLNEFDTISGKLKSKMSINNYVKAFNRKIIPVLLTILSTVFGLVPFVAFGDPEPFWFALAAGTIGGLLFSLLLFVVYLPVFTLKSVPKSLK